MDFLNFAQKISEIKAAPSPTATTLLTGLFDEAEFGEASLLVALCGPKPVWQTRPWLIEQFASEESIFTANLPGPHTLARVYYEMQQSIKNKNTTGPSYRSRLLASLDPLSADIASQLLAGVGGVESKDLETALARTRFRVGMPLPPEKLVRYTSEETEAVWQRLGKSYSHKKDDGYYCQLHKLNNTVLVFIGVALIEQTGNYSKIVEAVRAQVKAEMVILEGELVGLSLDGRVVPRRQIEQAVRHQVRLFDLLGVDGQDWRWLPYHTRRERKLNVVSDQPGGAICHVQEFIIDSAEALKFRFKECIEEGWEGLVLKQAETNYRSGVRNPNCIKLKHVEPVDAVIIGYFLNKHSGVETFLLAIYNDETKKFEACGRTKAGLSDQAVLKIEEMLETDIKSAAPATVVVDEPPDVWVQPRLVFEFLADYVYHTDKYPCGRENTGQGWALHNPKFNTMTPRLDKASHHTITIDQFLALRVEAGQKETTGSGTSKKDTSQATQQLSFDW